MRPFLGGVACLAERGFGLTALARPTSNLAYQPSGSLLQCGASGYPDQVFDLLQFEIADKSRRGEPAIEPHTEAGFGERVTQPGQESHQNADRSAPGRRISGAQDNGEKVLLTFVVELERPHYRQVAIGIVVRVERTQLLGPVRRVVRRIQVDRNKPRFAVQSLGMMLDGNVGHFASHP